MTVRCEHCGSPMRQRSHPHHRLFFAVLQRALENWPESERWQPTDVEDLRQYLLIKAGHFTKLDIRCDNPDAVSLEDQLRTVIATVSDKPPLLHTYPWGVRIFHAKSISYAAADRAEFNRISKRVFEIISDKLGVPIEKLKREAELEPA